MSQGFGRRGLPGDTPRSAPVETQWTGQPVATIVSDFRDGKIDVVTAPSTPISNLAYSARQVLKRMGLLL